MTPFLQSILAFPTVFFTILMGVILTYWLFVILGAVGIDALDGDVDLSAGAKAASGAFEGGAKAAGGVLEGADAHGHVDHAGHDHDVDGHDSGLFAALGFAGIPVTISSSFIVFSSWVLSLASRNTVFDLLGPILPGAVIGGGLFLLCAVLGTLMASVAVRPLRPVFIAKQAPGRDSLMGRVCIINSGSVSGNFGHATFNDGGAGVILNVFCSRDNQLKRGDQALILGYDPVRGVYEVEPVDFLLPEEIAQIHDPEKAAAIASRARDRAH
jgi:hypothetical protein